MYEIVSFRYRPYERIPSFTWKYLIETTCIIKQTDGGPYVADFTVFSKSLSQLPSKIKVNQKIVLICKEAKMACPSCYFISLSERVFINRFLKLFVSLAILSSLLKLFWYLIDLTENDRPDSVELLSMGQRRFNLP